MSDTTAPSAPSPSADLAAKAADLETAGAALASDVQQAAASVVPAAKTLIQRIEDVVARIPVGTHINEAVLDLAAIVRDLHDMVVKPQTPAAPPKQ